MRLKKHVCPDCGQPVFIKKMKRKVRSGSKSAKDFDFHIGDVELNGTVKFIWYEFRCTGCSNQFTEQKMREFEKAAKATAKAAAKQAKAEAKAANKK